MHSSVTLPATTIRANGLNALLGNTTGNDNICQRVNALTTICTCIGNTANGVQTLHNNTNGYSNTANGSYALYSNSTGSFNTAYGGDALVNTTGSNNIGVGFIGGSNLTTGSDNIDIGNQGMAVESSTIRVGTQGTQIATFIAGISGTVVGKGEPVFVDSNGQLGTKKSSERFKDQIKPMNKASEAILSLRPVTFHYKKQFDSYRVPQFGLIAEEVAKVDPDSCCVTSAETFQRFVTRK